MIPERRYCELRAQGRALEGDAVVYGDVAVFPWGRERIEAGAFAPVGDVILNRQHKRDLPLARTGGGGLVLDDSPQALRIRATLPAGVAAADETLILVREKILRGLSIEFFPRAESQVGDMRIIQRADLVGVGVVDSPQYPQSEVTARAEQRARGWRLRARIPYGKKLACKCIGRKCSADSVNFRRGSFDATLDDPDAEVLAVIGDYSRAIASRKRGTLRLRDTPEGLDVEIADLGSTTAADDLVSMAEGVPILARPILADDVFEEIAGVAVYTSARLRGITIGASDASHGWQPASIDAPRKRRMRIWF